MTYQLPHRKAAVSYINNGGSKASASKIFKVSRETLYRWLKLEDLTPKDRPKSYNRKIDKVKLRLHIEEFPDMYLRERGEIFGVKPSSMCVALAKLKIVKKRKSDI
jgi:putative transposase